MEISSDEGRHAAHAWDVLEWCIEDGGDIVVNALRGSIAALPRRIRSNRPAAAQRGRWEPYGIHGQLLEEDEYVRVRSSALKRLNALLARRSVVPIRGEGTRVA